MLKRDKIFYTACSFSIVGLILALMGYEASLLLFVAAYLLRPSLHEFGMDKKFADERELIIHSRSGNIAFVIIMLAIVGFIFWKLADGQSAGHMYTLLAIGIASRAITVLVMAGEYKNAGVIIIGAVGAFLALFIILEGGMTVVSVFGIVVGLVIIGVGQLGRFLPKTTALGLLVFALMVIFIFSLYKFDRNSITGWLFLVAPIVVSSACFILGSGSEDKIVSNRKRATVFGSIGTGAALVFVLLLINGSKEQGEKGGTQIVDDGEIVEIQGVACTGKIDYYEDGSLEFCNLDRVDTLSGHVLQAGTGVHFSKSGHMDWIFLDNDTYIQGYLTRGNRPNFMTSFYPNGQVNTVWLAEDQLIQGIPCARYRFLSSVFKFIHGKNGGTKFHNNGQLAYCQLSKNFEINEKSFRKSDQLWFDPEGNLINRITD